MKKSFLIFCLVTANLTYLFGQEKTIKSSPFSLGVIYTPQGVTFNKSTFEKYNYCTYSAYNHSTEYGLDFIYKPHKNIGLGINLLHNITQTYIYSCADWYWDDLPSSPSHSDLITNLSSLSGKIKVSYHSNIKKNFGFTILGGFIIRKPVFYKKHSESFNKAGEMYKKQSTEHKIENSSSFIGNYFSIGVDYHPFQNLVFSLAAELEYAKVDMADVVPFISSEETFYKLALNFPISVRFKF